MLGVALGSIYGALHWLLSALITKGALGLRVRCYCSALLHVCVAHRWAGASPHASDAPFGDNDLAELLAYDGLSRSPLAVLWHWLRICRCFVFAYHPVAEGQGQLCVVMLATENIHSYSKHAIEANRLYCQRHGYAFRLFVQPLAADRHPSWHKVAAVRSVLEEYSGVLWIDADAIITDFEMRIEQICGVEHDLVFTMDPPMYFNTLVNGGVWYCRNSAFGRAFLDRVWVTTPL